MDENDYYDDDYKNEEIFNDKLENEVNHLTDDEQDEENDEQGEENDEQGEENDEQGEENDEENDNYSIDNEDEYDDDEEFDEDNEIEKVNKNLISSIFGNLTNNESYINDLMKEDIYIEFDKKIHFNRLTIYEYIYISRMIKNLIDEKQNMREIVKNLLLNNQLDITLIRHIPYNKIIKVDLNELIIDINIFYKILNI